MNLIIKDLRKALLESDNSKTIKLFHGINSKNLNNIKNIGITSPNGYHSPEWFMLSTDFESALYHATPEKDGEDVFVIELVVPTPNNNRWLGYPYLWKGYVRDGNSSWFSLKQPIPKKFISNVHNVSNLNWLEQKSNGF
jgi:hypothetical protein